jgi:hypothetical protein
LGARQGQAGRSCVFKHFHGLKDGSGKAVLSRIAHQRATQIVRRYETSTKDDRGKMTDNTNKNDQFTEHQDFIVAEFNYIAQTAFQANEDRARVSEFFLISFGTFLAALFSSQLSVMEPRLVHTLFSILFIVVAFLGLLTTLELSRLRLAWLESVRSMNSMKDYLIRNHPTLNECFPWRTETVPKPFKPWSVGFMKALQVSILSGVSIGAAVTFTMLSFGNVTVNWCVSIFSAGFATILYMILFYYLPLRSEQK